MRLFMLVVIDFLRGRSVFFYFFKFRFNQLTERKNIIHKRELDLLIKYLIKINYRGQKNSLVQILEQKESFSKLLILDKKFIQNSISMEKIKLPFNSVKVFTGGSTTGTPVTFIEDRRSMDYSRAFFYNALYDLGWNFSKKWIKLWGRPQKNEGTINYYLNRYKNSSQNCKIFNAFEMSDQLFLDLYNYISSNRISHIYAYVNAIVEFGTYLKDNNLSVNLDFILTTAEVLTDYNRDFLSKTFNCPVYNGYACTEINSVAYEKPGIEGLVVNKERVLVEIVNGNNEIVPNGVSGRILLTDLQKRTFPLIRYETGDLGVLESIIVNNVEILLLKKIEGRVSDLIVLSNNKTMHSTVFQFRLADFFRLLDVDLLQFQIIQSSKENLIIRLKLTNNYHSSINEELRVYFEEILEGFKIKIEINNKFDVAVSGKTKYFIRNF